MFTLESELNMGGQVVGCAKLANGGTSMSEHQTTNDPANGLIFMLAQLRDDLGN